MQYDVTEAAQKIRQWQKESGLRGGDVARRLGISHAHYSDIRRGKKRGSIQTLTKLVALFDKTLDDLLGPQSQTARDQSKEAEMDTIRAVLPIVDYWKDNLTADEMQKLKGLFATTRGRRLFVRLAKECIAEDGVFLQGLTSLLALSESRHKT